MAHLAQATVLAGQGGSGLGAGHARTGVADRHKAAAVAATLGSDRNLSTEAGRGQGVGYQGFDQGRHGVGAGADQRRGRVDLQDKRDPRRTRPGDESAKGGAGHGGGVCEHPWGGAGR